MVPSSPLTLDDLPAAAVGRYGAGAGRLTPGSNRLGPDDGFQARVAGDAGVTVGDMDRDDPRFHVPRKAARPWRAEATEGGIYRRGRVVGPRSADRTCG